MTNNVNSAMQKLQILMDANMDKARSALKDIAQELTEETKRTITDQTESWPPLNPITLAHKAPETRILIDTGIMLDSITNKQINENTYTIGVHRDARSERGDIAALMESGDNSQNLPPRPFMAPTMKRVREDLAAKLRNNLGL